MNLLLTGGAGALGSNIVEFIGGDYEQIVVLDNFATGKRASLPKSGNLRVIEGSIEDPQLLANLVSELRPRHVIHAAASYKDPKDWITDIRTNVLGTCNLLRAVELHPPERFIYLQTALCYGRASSVPIRVTESLRPFTSYGLSKAAGEQYVVNSELSATSLRLANVTGPRLAIGPIPTFYQRLKSGKPCFVSAARRDFMDVSDFIALLRLALRPNAPTGVFNVSTGEATTIREVYGIVAEHLGLSVGAIDVRAVGNDDVSDLVLDPSETARQFGWTCQVSAVDSIRNLLRWYDLHGVTKIHSHLNEDWGASR